VLAKERYLAARGALTSQGVVENQLARLFAEMKQQQLVRGQFNASTACSEMANVKKGKGGAVFQEFEDCYAQALQLHSAEWTNDNGEVLGMHAVFRKLWAELSKDIHGAPWSGPNVRVLSNKLDDGNLTLLKCLIRKTHLEIDET